MKIFIINNNLLQCCNKFIITYGELVTTTFIFVIFAFLLLADIWNIFCSFRELIIFTVLVTNTTPNHFQFLSETTTFMKATSLTSGNALSAIENKLILFFSRRDYTRTLGVNNHSVRLILALIISSWHFSDFGIFCYNL